MKKLFLILGLVLLVAACSPQRGYYGGHCGYWNSGYSGGPQHNGYGYGNPEGMRYPASADGY